MLCKLHDSLLYFKKKKLNVLRTVASRICPNLLLMLSEKDIVFITGVFSFRIWMTEILCHLELIDIHGHFTECYMTVI